MKPQKIPQKCLSVKIESEEKGKCDNRKLLSNPKILLKSVRDIFIRIKQSRFIIQFNIKITQLTVAH